MIRAELLGCTKHGFKVTSRMKGRVAFSDAWVNVKGKKVFLAPKQ